MPKRFKHLFRVAGTVAMAAAALFLLASCGLGGASAVGEGRAAEGDAAESAGTDLTRISIRNATDSGGLAGMTGNALKDEGYVYANGYAIDIGNAAYQQRSFVIVPEGDEDLRSEADRLGDFIGLEVLCDSDRFHSYPQYSDGKGTVMIVFGTDCHRSFPFYEYADDTDYPLIRVGDDTILQIEPYEG